MKYIISMEAVHDLEQIWIYTFETWSIEQADRYFNLITDEIEFIAEKSFILNLNKLIGKFST